MKRQFTYKFGEDAILAILEEYVQKTYNEHYSSDKIQTIEYLQSKFGSTDFIQSSIIKYASRGGEKEGEPIEKDILKVMHYAMFWYYFAVIQKLQGKDDD